VLKLIIEDDEGRKSVVPFARDELSIGRQEGNAIRLSERNVSRHHARLRRVDERVVVEDLGSSYGIRINGQRVRGESTLRVGDLLQIGDYDLTVEPERAEQPASTPARERIAQAPTRVDAPAITDGLRLTEDQTATEQLDTSGTDLGEVVDVPAEKAPRLLVLNTDLAGREFACILGRLRMGRSYDNDIAIDHPSLSRTHARLVLDDEGRWELIDTGSVNGVKVNGESRDRAFLTDQDEFELGHVRLRFLDPTFKPKRRHAAVRALLASCVAAGLIVLSLVGLMAFAPAQAEDHLPRAVLERLAFVSPRVAAAIEDEAAAQASVLETVPEGLTRGELKRVTAAVEAANARRFQQAVELLEGIPEEDRSLSVAEMLDRARAELEVREMLSEAQRLIDEGAVPEAQALATAARDTRAFHRELSVMRGRLATARTAWIERTRSEREERQEQVASVYREGRAALAEGRLREAESAFQRCIALEARAAACHLGLGGTYARTAGKAELGATHYEAFLELSPEDPVAPEVKLVLSAYQKSRRAAGE